MNIAIQSVPPRRYSMQQCAERLRPLADALPAAPGVYLFIGADGVTPQYVGKSVNLRSRVLSHLRDRGNLRLLAATHGFQHRRTAGGIGALLLEAQLVKQHQPPWNRRLKRCRELCALRLGAGGRPEIVQARDVDFAATEGLYGLFRGRKRAAERLQSLADEHQLCYGALGLERLPAGRACFRAALGRCRGVCRGEESSQAHADRLRAALLSLTLRSWPWPGAVGLVEAGSDLRQVHVVRNWCYLGSVAHERDAAALARLAPGFDLDGYRILYKPMLDGHMPLIEL